MRGLLVRWGLFEGRSVGDATPASAPVIRLTGRIATRTDAGVATDADAVPAAAGPPASGKQQSAIKDKAAAASAATIAVSSGSARPSSAHYDVKRIAGAKVQIGTHKGAESRLLSQFLPLLAPRRP